MKKVLLIAIICVMISPFTATGQENGIKFRHDMKWEEVLSEAKKENKLVFVDFYTQWCGPCFNMAKTVFTLPDVGYFYNNNFISVKVDCEEPQQGVALAKKYGVKSYPTYGFIDPVTGELVHRSSSRQSASRFIQTGRDAMNPQKRSFVLEEKYAKGDRSSELLKDYIDYNASIYKRDNVNKAFDELIAGGASLKDSVIWNTYVEHISGINKYLRYVSDNYKELCKLYGKTAVDGKLRKETQYGDPGVIASLTAFEGKDFNLKFIEINNLLRDKNYVEAASKIDELIADKNVNRQEVIDRLKYIARVNYKPEELPDFWFEKCVGYLKFIAYNDKDRDNASIHQQYADALELLLKRKLVKVKGITDTPSFGKKTYDLRSDGLKAKPQKRVKGS